MKIYVYKQCFVIKIYQSLTTLDQFRTYKVGKVLIERQTVLHEVNNNKKQLPTSVELNINQIRFVYLPPLHWKIITKLEDLNFADDIGRISSSKQRIQTKTDKLTQKAGKLE